MKRITEGFTYFRNIRTRLLAWYFLLAVCTTGMAVWVTRQIYCSRLDDQAKSALTEEVERFQRLAKPLTTRPAPASQIAADVSDLFDQLLANYVPANNEGVATFAEGKLYAASPYAATLLQAHPDLLNQWQTLEAPQQRQVHNGDRRFFYIAEPLVIGGETQGVFVALHDSTAAYQSGTEAIALVLKVSIAVLAGFFIIAWITAGRLLRPLRLINQTARDITACDMTQRIPLRGSDEITEVAATFNAMLDRLQNAFDGQQEFLKDVSHELRTPITVVQGQLEMLAYRPDKQPQTIALILSELEHMQRLVNDLLLLTKAERPDFLILKPEDLDWLTEELFFKARSLTPDRDWQLEAKGLYPVVLDHQRFSQAVMNLVQNAIRHTQPKEAIALGSIVSDGYLRFWVRDSGEGIATADQEKIFERFARANPHHHRFEGAGLGLSIVSAIAQAHGGHVELSSQPGQGATFTLVLPVEPRETQSETTTYESHPDRRGQPTHR